MFKNKARSGNNFHFKDQIPTDLTFGVVYKIQCRLGNESYHGECVRHLNVRIGEHIGISPLTKKQVKSKNSSTAYYLLFCNQSTSYGDFSILTRESKIFLLELKEYLLVMRGQPSLNGNITSARFYLLDRYLLEFHLLLIVATLFLLNGPFIMCMCMSTTVNVNDTVQFTFFLVMRLNITIVTSCDSLIATFAP